MKLVRSLLTSAAFAAAMVSASFSFGQCCGGASYNTIAAAAPASGCGCSYTVMKTVQRTINEQQQVTKYRTVNETVYDTQQVPTTRTVNETAYRTENYTVQRPVRETIMKTESYTVQRPVRETIMKTVNSTIQLSLIHI